MQRRIQFQVSENWWNAYSSHAAPVVVLTALSKRDVHGDSLMATILGDKECAQAGDKILAVFEDYLQKNMTDALLHTLSLTNEVGANVLHVMNHSCDTRMFTRWMHFLVTMLDGEVALRSKHCETIYQLLNQEVVVDGKSDSRMKLIDLISERHRESITAYVTLVNKLAQYGLATEKLVALKGDSKKSHKKFESVAGVKSVMHHLKEAVFGERSVESHLLKFHLHAKPCVLPHCLDSKEIPSIPMNP